MTNIHSLRDSGGINSYIYSKLKKISSSTKQSISDEYINKSMLLSELGVDSDEKLKKIICLNQILKKSNLNPEKNIYKKIAKKIVCSNINNTNDYYYFIVEAALENDIKKIAYPNPGIYDEQIGEERNLASWSKIVNKIYSAVYSKEMSFDNAVDYYSSGLDVKSGEDEQFKRWIKYYKDGDHTKYSEKNSNIKKNASYQIPLVTDAYTYDDFDIDRGFDMESEARDAKKKVDKKQSYKTWKRKLNLALRRIDKLIRSHEDVGISPDVYEELARSFFRLDTDINKTRLPETTADLAYRAANKFKKLGFDSGADILIKVAQEAPREDPMAGVSDVDLSEDTGSNVQPQGSGQAEDSEEKKRMSAADADPVPLEEINPIPGPGEAEYSILAKDISLGDAASKLEDVAGMLADRRIIRYLAEFDIMLDKLGIATMFPELAESQAKLIDAYGYALTRVSKMLGMVSNSQQLLDAETYSKKDVGSSDMQKELSPEAKSDAVEGGATQPEPTRRVAEQEGQV